MNNAKAHPTTDGPLWLPADFGVLVHGHLLHRLGGPSSGKRTYWDNRFCDPSKIFKFAEFFKCVNASQISIRIQEESGDIQEEE